jgi:hypothetical protein
MTHDNDNNKLNPQLQPFAQPLAQPQPQPQRTKTAREIEAAIGETRNALSDDVKALSEKASPAHLKQEAKQAIKGARDAAVDKVVESKDVIVEKAVEIKDAAVEKATQGKDAVVEKAVEIKDAAVETAHEAADVLSETYDEVSYQTRRIGAATWRFTKANALPLGLIGLGAGLLLSNQRRASPRATEPIRDDWDDEVGEYVARDSVYPGSNPHPAYGGPATDYGNDDGLRDERARYAAGYSTGTEASRRELAGEERRNGHPADRERERERKRRPSATKRAQRAAADVKDDTVALTARAGQAWHSAQKKVADGARSGGAFAQTQLRRVRDGSRDLAQRNPLAFAFGTLVAGVGLGLLLPATSREDKLLAPSRETVRRAIGRARETADDVGRVVKRTAQDTMATVEGHTH